MYTSINCCCFPPHLETEECIRIAAGTGFAGIELCMEENKRKAPNVSLFSSEEDLQEIYKRSLTYGIKISSLSTNLLWLYPLTDNDDTKREKAQYIIRKMIDAAKILKCDTILVVPGSVTEDVAYDVAYRRALEGIKKIMGYAEESHIHVGIENVWNKFLLSPLEMKRFLSDIASEYACLYFDVGNILQWGFPEQWINIMGDRIVRVHMKDFDRTVGNISGFRGLFQGDLNYPAVMAALRKCGYDSYLTAEIEYAGGDVMEFVTRIKQDLEKIIML